MRFILSLLVFFASTQISCGQTEEAIRKAFNEFEINQDEALDGDELKACRCEQYDVNGDGAVSYAEYKAGRKGLKPKVATPAQAGALTRGSKVEVAMGENWYKATVVAVKGDYYKVQLPGEGDDVPEAWINKTKVRLASGSTATTIASAQTAPVKNAGAWEAGSKVEIDYQGTWYPGSIMEVKGGQYKIHYDGYSDSWDSWVTKDKLRAPRSNNQPAPAPVGANTTTTNATFATGTYYAGMEIGYGWRFYYFLPGNKVAWGCITGGLEYYNSSTANPTSMGTYSKAGNNLTINWNSGSTKRTTLDRDGAFETNEGLFVKQYKVPPRLSANYSASNSVAGASTSTTYQFRADGRFIIDKVAGYDNNDGRWGGETASNKKGTYKITGYTITLSFEDGSVTRHTIFSQEEGPNPESLGWDCGYLTREK